MKTYGIDADLYAELWINVEEAGDRDRISHEVFDRWLSIFHGITALEDEVDENNCYPFFVRDEKKFSWALLRYS
jgi:hypothetical protein